ncbi:MAG: Stk1 family PASTA domain-containing Ser/Thr kinase [Oscillospiraceae bacterium]|nr:Stk1 family PASTA domain-containing Ser/Thr kinase [Oscillospiraceae bacterium]
MEYQDKYIGKMLDNRYEILEKIGTGGMAVVYKAKCHRLNRMVAVKILKEELAEDEEFRRRFRTESQAVAMLSHPNIVNVYDVSRTGNIEYIVMELIEGITLKQYINRKGLLNWKETLHFTTQIVKALSHAHSRGIVHRDIKPHNIMILKDGTVKVADFGIARLVSSQNTMTQEAIGSVHYISPEQAKGAQVDARSDLYSLGVVMYEMLTSRLPFVGDSAVAVAIQHISAIPLMPREINPDIPFGMEEITMHAMEANLQKRYASAEEMLADLEEFRKNPAIVFGYGSLGSVGTDAGQDNTVVIPAPVKREPSIPVKTPARRSAEMTNDEYRKNRRKSGQTGVLIGILMVLLFAIVLFVFMWRFFLKDMIAPENETIIIPKFVGSQVDDVVNNPDYEGIYNFTIDRVVDADAQEGEIIKQTPKEGKEHTLTNSGIAVTLTVAEAQESEVLMPSVLNMDYREATNLINRLGLLVTIDTQGSYDDKVDANLVMNQIPAANQEIRDGDTIYLTYSMGPEEKLTTVPSVTGLSMSAAISRLTENKLQYKVTYEASDRPVDEVIYQNMEAGDEVPENSVVVISCSDGSKIPAPEPEIQPAPEPETQPETNPGEDTELTDPEELPGEAPAGSEAEAPSNDT